MLHVLRALRHWESIDLFDRAGDVLVCLGNSHLSFYHPQIYLSLHLYCRFLNLVSSATACKKSTTTV